MKVITLQNVLLLKDYTIIMRIHPINQSSQNAYILLDTWVDIHIVIYNYVTKYNERISNDMHVYK